jgi:hypothetical protein
LCLSNVLAEGAKYLIITHDDFYDAIQPLAQWKNKKGVMTTVVDKTTIEEQGGGWDSDAIRNYIIDAYDTWDPRPEYVLLVGHWSYTPLGKYFSHWNYLGKTWTDQYYADITDNAEYKDDIYLGRLPCSTTTQCEIMVNKIISYERGNLKNNNWFIKATGIARDTSPDSTLWRGLYRDAIRSIRSLLMNIGFNRVDTLFASQGADRTAVEDSVSNGRGFVVYRGGVLAATDNWRNPLNVRPESIYNDSMPTIVISTSCRTMFLYDSTANSERDSAAGKRWLRQGTITIPKGAVGFWGATTHYYGVSSTDSAHSTFATAQVYWRNAAAVRFFRAITQESEHILGKAIRKAKDSAWVCCSLNTHNYTNDSPRACSVAYMEWNLLGDPELNLWTATPQPMVVNHEQYISPGSQNFTMSVTKQDSAPICSALVCVMIPNDPNNYHVGYTNSSGQITFDINPTHAPDSMWVTVTARNYRPYEGKCDVLYLVSENSTFPNTGKHLVRKPNTSQLHRVYETNGKVFYQMSSNWGQTWSIPAYVDSGTCPTIALSSDGNTPWIIYADLDLAGTIQCAVRRTDDTWKIRTIYEGDELQENYNIGPSIVMATITNELGDLAYAVFSDNYERIFFVAFDTIRNYGEPPYQVIDESYPCLAPSISITPADLLHIVWQRDIEDGKIFYKTTLENVHPDDIRHDRLPEWSDPYQVSDAPGYPTEPASNPSVEAYGDYVYAAWRGPNVNGEFPGDIWRRARWLERPPDDWYPPENKSETPKQESNYPVMSTDFATVWQEQVSDTNWDIYGNIGDYTGQLFETPKSSKYPHIDGYWDPAAPIATFYCYTIWTEEIAHPLYEVRFDRYEWTSGKSAFDHDYYAVEIGETIPSPYCIERTGYLQYGPYTIDYGNQKLKYKLPFLHPSYYYDLRAIVYQQGQNNWSQNFDIDSALSTTITFEPNRPETVWIRLPQESYKNDTKVKQEIKKILGNRAVIADLRLYQVEEIDTSGSEGGAQSAGSALVQRPLLYQSYPNPAKTRAVIRYSLPVAGKVSLTIYDISGRAVRNLVDENKESGIYSINWDSKDDKGRSLAQGVYFYRLKSDRFSDTKRMVLIR